MLGGRVLLLLLQHELLLLLHKLHLKRLLLLRSHIRRLGVRTVWLESELLLLEHHLLICPLGKLLLLLRVEGLLRELLEGSWIGERT